MDDDDVTMAAVATTSGYASKFANFAIPLDAIGDGREDSTRGLVREEHHHQPRPRRATRAARGVGPCDIRQLAPQAPPPERRRQRRQ